MLGEFLSSLETSFSLAEKFKSIYFHGLGYDFYDRFIHTLRGITPETIMELAKKYLDIESLSLVIVGGEK
jgi:predicted Zn-dependent peptidase